MKNQIWLGMLILLVAGGCAKKAAVQETADSRMVVTTAVATQRTYAPERKWAGTIRAEREANLGTTFPGKVDKMYCYEGETVKKGALLAELSGEMLVQAQVEYDAVKKDYERMQRLLEKGSVTQMDFDHIRAKLEATEAKLDLIRKNTQLVAPFRGVVADVLVHEGENFSLVPQVDVSSLSVSSGIIRLVQTDPLEVEFDVPENDIVQLHRGQEISVSCDALPGKTMQAHISMIDPVLSPSTHSGKVKAELRNTLGMLKPGMYAHVSVPMEKVQAVFIPLSALVRQEGSGEEYVFVLHGNKVSRVDIRKTDMAGDAAAVTGLQPGDQVVVAGKGRLHDGAEITVQK